MSSAKTPRLSIIVPTYKRPERIRTLLERLEHQTLPAGEFEVIVVDDGSPEPIQVALDRPYALQLLRQENRGPGAARNTALARCSGELCVILNDDVVPAPDLLERHATLHHELARAGRARLAVLGTFHFTASARLSPFTQLLDRTDLLFDFSPLVHERVLAWPFFWTCNISLPTKALRDAGGFDERTFFDIVEDCELGYRLEKQGWRILYREDVRAEHEHVLNPAGFFERTRKLGRGLVKMFKKHGDPTVLRLAPGKQVDDEVVRQWLTTYEALRPQQDKFETLLAKIEREHAGRELPQALVEQLGSAVARINAVPLCRGFLEEWTGRDPELVRMRGPRPSRLVSIIMPSFDALPATRRTLAALRAARDPEHPQEILVVDNGSRDGSREFLAAQPDVRLIANAENLGAPRARNQALAQAEGEWIVFMDNDVLVTPHWLERLLYHAQIDARAGCVGPLSDRAAHEQQIPYAAGEEPEQLAGFAEAHYTAHARQFRFAGLLSSFLMLVPRTLIDGIGGFDERFSPWGFEDDDFTLRAALFAGHNRVALDVFVRHLGYGGAKAARHEALLEENWKRFRDKWGFDRNARRGDYSGLSRLFQRSWSSTELLVSKAAPDRALEVGS